MLDLVCDVLRTALTVAEAASIFLLEVRRRLLLRIIRLLNSTEALVNQIQEHSLGQVAELGHSVQDIRLADTYLLEAARNLC